MKKVAIFALYTQETIDEYILELLKEMKSNVDYQIVVVNGSLSQEEVDKHKNLVDKFMFRENEGFDIAGYRQGFIDNYEIIKQYDQIVFYNQSIFGPFYPFSEMFDIMDKKDLDFWGITKHQGVDVIPDWAKHIGHIPPHLQSYFLVVNKNMFTSKSFYDYFDQLKKIKTYDDAVGYFEIMFTTHFEKLGYKWQEYIDTSEYFEMFDYPLMSIPTTLIRDKRCPVAKRKSFLFERNLYTIEYYGSASQKLYDYIENESDYNFSLILKNLTKTVDLHTLTYSFTPYYFNEKTIQEKTDTTVFVYIDNKNLINELKNKIENIKQCSTIIILSNNEELLNYFEGYNCVYTTSYYDYFINLLENNLIKTEYVALVTNSTKEVYDEWYDLSLLNNSFNIILNIKNNIDIFNRNKSFGILTTFLSQAGNNFYKQYEWSKIKPYIEQNFIDNGINIKIGDKIPPVCNAGMFFAKTNAIKIDKKVLLCVNEATSQSELLNTKEILLPLTAQNNNYLTGFVFDKENMASDLANADDMISAIKLLTQEDRDVRYDIYLDSVKSNTKEFNLKRNHMTLNQAYKAKLSIKEKLYIIYHLLFNKEEKTKC